MKKIFTFILISIFALSFFLVLYTYNLNNTLLNKNFYKEQLRKEKVYNQAVVVGVNYIIESKSSFLKGLTLSGNDLVDIANATIPSSWIQIQTENALDQIFPYLLNQTDSFQVLISTRSLKNDFSKNFERVLKEKIQDKKPCSKEEIAAILKTSTLPNCRPPEKELNQFLSLGFSETIVEEIPNEIIFSDKNFPEVAAQLTTLRSGLGLLPTLFNLSLTTLALVFLLILLLIPRNRKSILRWFGFALTLATLGPLITSAAISQLFFGLIPSLFAELGFPPSVNNFFLSFARSILGQFFAGIQIQTLAIFSLGLILLITSFLIYVKEKPSQKFGA